MRDQNILIEIPEVMVMNPCLAAALEELSSAGIRNAEWKITGKHLLVRWEVKGKEHLYCMTLKPNNDAANTRASIRELILRGRRREAGR